MKRLFIVLFILMILLPVFADEQSSTTADSLTDNSFVIRGFYKGAVSSAVSIVIKDYSTSRLYENSVEVSDNLILNKDGRVFTWTMTGTATRSVTLKFTFSILQAHFGEKYYMPSYKIKMSMNQTTSETGTTLYDPMYNSNSTTKNVANKTKNNQPTPFSETGTAQYQGDIPASGANYGTKRNPKYQGTYSNWVRSGYCTLNITDYENNTAGSYEYSCHVTVELTTQ